MRIKKGMNFLRVQWIAWFPIFRIWGCDATRQRRATIRKSHGYSVGTNLEQQLANTFAIFGKNVFEFSQSLFTIYKWRRLRAPSNPLHVVGPFLLPVTAKYESLVWIARLSSDGEIDFAEIAFGKLSFQIWRSWCSLIGSTLVETCFAAHSRLVFS